MALVHMIGVNFSISSSITNISGAFQSRDHDYISDIEEVKDGNGTCVTKVYYNSHETATFTYVATGTNGSAGVAVTVPVVGSVLTITDSGYAAIAGTTWLVDSVKTAVTNVSSLRVTLGTSRYPAITS